MTTEGRRILITGISGRLSGRLAQALESRDDVDEIVGVDVKEPTVALDRTEFVRADLRNPLVGRIVQAAKIDTVVHLSVMARPGEAGGRAAMKEHNIIGAMQLLAACQQSDSLTRVILKSSTAVYGSDHADPGLFRENARPTHEPEGGFGKDITEVEGYARAFARRRPDVDLTMLRFANFLGDMDSVLGSFFALPVVPSVLGYDPRLQFVHEDDGVEALRRATIEHHPGVFNVAGAGVVYLSQCVRVAGRVQVPVPLPLVTGVAGLLRRAGRMDFSAEQLKFLQFGRAVDTTHLEAEFGWTPQYSSREAFEDYVGRRRIHAIISRDEVARIEGQIYDFLQRKGQERFLASRRSPT